MGIFNAGKDYRSYRKELGSDTPLLYLKKILFSVVLAGGIYLPLDFFYIIEHNAIAGILVSMNAIVVSFLVFSMTILITKENEDRIKNTTIKYVDLLISNTEVNTSVSFISIFVNLLYLYTANSVLVNLTPYHELYIHILGFLALFLTIFVIKFAIDDLLFISKSYRTRSR